MNLEELVKETESAKKMYDAGLTCVIIWNNGIDPLYVKDMEQAIELLNGTSLRYLSGAVWNVVDWINNFGMSRETADEIYNASMCDCCLYRVRLWNGDEETLQGNFLNFFYPDLTVIKSIECIGYK